MPEKTSLGDRQLSHGPLFNSALMNCDGVSSSTALPILSLASSVIGGEWVPKKGLIAARGESATYPTPIFFQSKLLASNLKQINTK